MKTLEDIDLKELLPSSIASDETVVAMAEAITPQLKPLLIDDTAPFLLNIDKLPSLVLDHLAMQFDIKTWRDTWNVSLKRSVLKNAIADKKILGTVLAIERAVASFGSAVKIVEWWQEEPKGTPHTFKIYVTLDIAESDVNSATQDDIIKMVDYAKPARSHYELILQKSIKGNIGVYAHMRAITYSRIG